MEGPLPTLVLVLLGYLVGSIPMGVIVARATGGIDPRSMGSGRIGTTNVRRAMGDGRGLLVAVLDIAKGLAPVLLARAAGASVEVQALVGLAAVVGSWKSVFIRFAGGRGVGTWFGGLLLAAPLVALLCVPLYAVIIRATGLISLASLVGTVFAAVAIGTLAVAGLLDPAWLLYAVPAAALVWIAHRDNIGRIRAGTEPRVDRPSRGEPAGPRESG